MFKSLVQLEREFLRAARAAATMPSTDNRRKAQKAYDKLPTTSRCYGMKFEGTK